MRVIAGSARKTILITPDGLDTRPTTDRIKETLFNMINNDIYDCNFLDLFSGSGGIGIEALSRGADKSYFVESNRNAIQCIKTNLKKTHFEDKGIVLERDVISAIELLENTDIIFDIIFMDPPYNKEWEKKVLLSLSNSKIINEYTTIIIEMSLETKTDYLEEYGFKLVKRKDYKTNSHVFIMKEIRR